MGRVGQREGGRRLRLALGRVVEQTTRRCCSDHGQDGSCDGELDARVDARVRSDGRGGRTDEDADAPEAVEARHHRPAERPLDERSVRVDRHVGEAGSRAEHEQGCAERASEVGSAGRTSARQNAPSVPVTSGLKA